ncbi:MAG TPA: hypothetical protein VNJ54_12645 [Plantibacter sp.]|uniref:hypothetical protein n=1 Tax=Plantibacter sp. TaxID=1871045 RepID=UPI002CAA6E04|nr:hypothetical protein [Plantibacter sp.]
MSLKLAPDPEIVMSADELWDAIGVLSRVLREANRRQLPADLYGKLDVARGVTLGMYSTAHTYEKPSS